VTGRIRKIQTGINLVKNSADHFLATSSPAIKKKVFKRDSIITIEDPIIRRYIKTIGVDYNNVPFFSEIKEISLKLVGVKDKFIKEAIYNKIEQAKITRKCIKTDLLIGLLDVYHTVKGHYSPIGGKVQEFFKYLKENVSRRKAKKIVKKDGVFNDYNLLKKSFEKARKLEPLKEFCFNFNKTNPEITNYLYKTYYLPKLDSKTSKLCQKISDEFGTKVFLEHNHNEKAAKAIYKELSEWKKAGGDEVVFPNDFDCSRIKQNYINNCIDQAGFIELSCDSHETINNINVENDTLISIQYALRHEMTHLNDKKLIIKGEYHPGVIKQKSGKRRFEGELENAEVPNIDYAYTSRPDFIACASQGDYSKYSDHFKKVLVRLGMPEWELKMKPVKDMDYFGE